MKNLRSLLLLFLITASLAAQDAPAPQPAPAADTSTAPAPAPAPAPSPAPAPAATAPTPTNPLAPTPATAPAATAPTPDVSISLPPASTDTSASASGTGTASDIMHKANFPNEDVRTIISSIATLFNLNVVIPDSLAGTTTIQLHDVTWQQIFKYVLDPLGYTFTIDGTGPNAVIQIKNKSEVATEPLETRVIPVNSAQAADLAKSLQIFLDTSSKPPETITPDPRTNFLIVTAHPSKMNNIQEAIERLDQPTQQVFIETKFIEVDANDTKDLGIDWNFNGTPLGSLGYAYQYGIYEGLGAINASGSLPSTGLPELTASQAAVSPTPANNINLQVPSTGLNPIAPSRKALDLAVFNQAQYTAVLQAFQTITNATLISDPTAVTMDNQEVTLFSGTNITVVFPSVNNSNGVATAGNNTVYQVGITMKVKPHTTNNGFINLLLNPELSRVDPVSDTYFNGTYPRIDTRRLTDANVSIKDGFTLAIGGLIDDQDSIATTQVPILGDIPIIGELFKSRNNIRQRNNLIIFVTARTLSNDGASYTDVVTNNELLRSGITADQIPGYYNSTPKTPGMTYASKDELDTMANVQKLRDEAAQLQAQQETIQKEIEAQAMVDALKKSSPTPSH